MKRGLLMNEQDVPLTPAGGPTGSPGELLRAARQAAGLHIDALAVSLKVSVSKLQALESDNFDVFPDTIFVRALAASVCRTLKIDAAPVLALMPQGNKYTLPQNNRGINEAFRGDFGGRSAFWRNTSPLKNPTAWAVMVLLMGALVLVFLPRTPEDSLGAGVDSVPSVPADVVASQNAPRAESVMPTPPAPDRAEVVQTPVAQALKAVASTPAPVKEKAASMAAVAAVAPSAPSLGASAVPMPSGTLVFKARSSSWVKVRDAAGATVLQRTLAAGESVAVPSNSSLPWSVVVGRADVTDVYVRGALFDVVSASRENVARFEVK